MQQKEYKKIISWFFVFLFVLSLFSPVQVYAFGYKDGNTDELMTIEAGDILRKGQTYKLNRFISKTYGDYDNTIDITLQNSAYVSKWFVYATIKDCITKYVRQDDAQLVNFSRIYTSEYHVGLDNFLEPDWADSVEEWQVHDEDINNQYVEITPTENIIFSSVQSVNNGSCTYSALYLQFYKVPDTNIIDTLKIGTVLKGGVTYGFLYDDTIDKTGFAEKNAKYNDDGQLLNYGSARPDIINYSGVETDASNIRALSLFNMGSGNVYPDADIYIDGDWQDDPNKVQVQGAMLSSYLFTKRGAEEYEDLDGSKKILPKYGDWTYMETYVVENKDDYEYLKYTPALTIITLPAGHSYKYVKNPWGNEYYFETVPGNTVNYFSSRTHNKIYTKSIPINTSGALTEQDIQTEQELSKYKTDKYYTYSDNTFTETDVSDISSDMDLYLIDKYCYVMYKDFDTDDIIGYRKITKGASVDFDENATYYSDEDMTVEKSYTDILSPYKNKTVTYYKDKNNNAVTVDDTKVDDLSVFVKGTLNMNRLTIKNKVSGNASNTSDNFKYVLTLTDYDSPITCIKNGQSITENLVNNKLEFTLSSIDDVIAFEIPKNTAYSVDLIDSKGYATNRTKSDGTLTEDKEIEFDLSKTASTPSTPSTPTEPTNPSEPSTPTTPSNPSTPSTPSQPSTEPTTPSTPSTPSTEPSDTTSDVIPDDNVVPDKKTVTLKIYDYWGGKKILRETKVAEKGKTYTFKAKTIKGYYPLSEAIKVKADKDKDVIFLYDKYIKEDKNVPDKKPKHTKDKTTETIVSPKTGQDDLTMILFVFTVVLLLYFRKKSKES